MGIRKNAEEKLLSTSFEFLSRATLKMDDKGADYKTFMTWCVPKPDPEIFIRVAWRAMALDSTVVPVHAFFAIDQIDDDGETWRPIKSHKVEIADFGATGWVDSSTGTMRVKGGMARAQFRFRARLESGEAIFISAEYVVMGDRSDLEFSDMVQFTLR